MKARRPPNNPKGISPFSESSGYDEENYNSWARCGQYNEDYDDGRITGIGRYVSTCNGVSEGQWDENGCLTGFGRFIWNDGSYHIGWFHENAVRGYGIGNFYTNGQGVKEGLYDDYYFREDGFVNYDVNEYYA